MPVTNTTKYNKTINKTKFNKTIEDGKYLARHMPVLGNVHPIKIDVTYVRYIFIWSKLTYREYVLVHGQIPNPPPPPTSNTGIILFRGMTRVRIEVFPLLYLGCAMPFGPLSKWQPSKMTKTTNAPYTV